MAELIGKPLDYNTIAAIKQRLGTSDPSVAQMPLAEFASLANRVTGTSNYAAALDDNVVKQVSSFVDRVMSPVSEPLGEVGAALGGLVDEPDFGRMLGKELPRGLLELLPVAKGWQLGQAGHRMLGALTSAPGIASTAAKTYAETGSPAAGAVGAAGMATLFPMVGAAQKAVGRGIQSLFYEPVKDVAGTVIGRSAPQGMLAGFGERVAEISARETAAAVNQYATIQGVNQAATGEWAPNDKQMAMMVVGAQLPFTLLDVPYALRGFGRTASGEALPRSGIEADAAYQMAQRQLSEELARKARVPGQPETLRKEAEAEVAAVVDEVMAKGGKQVEETRALERRLETLGMIRPGVRQLKPLLVAKMDQGAVRDLAAAGAIVARPDGGYDVVSAFVNDPARYATLEALKTFSHALPNNAELTNALTALGYSDAVQAAMKPAEKRLAVQEGVEYAGPVKGEAQVRATEQPDYVPTPERLYASRPGEPLTDTWTRLARGRALQELPRPKRTFADAAERDPGMFGHWPAEGGVPGSREPVGEPLPVSRRLNPPGLVGHMPMPPRRARLSARLPEPGFAAPEAGPAERLPGESKAVTAGEVAEKGAQEHRGPIKPMAEATWPGKLETPPLEAPAASYPATGRPPVEAPARQLPPLPIQAYSYLKNVFRETWLKMNEVVDRMNWSAVYQLPYQLRGVRHEVYGLGDYHLGDLGEVRTVDLDGGVKQVYLDDRPTEMVQLADGAYREAELMETTAATWQKPVVTRMALKDNFDRNEQNLRQVRQAYMTQYLGERDKVLKMYGAIDLDTLRVLAGLKEVNAADLPGWGVFLDEVVRRHEGGVELRRQVLGMRARQEALERGESLERADLAMRKKEPKSHEAPDAAVKRGETLEEILAEAPPEFRAKRLTELSEVLMTVLREATMVEKTTKVGGKVGKSKTLHPEWARTEAEYKRIEQELQEQLRGLPPAEAADRVYRHHLAKVAEMTTRIQRINDRMERELRRNYLGTLFTEAQGLARRRETLSRQELTEQSLQIGEKSKMGGKTKPSTLERTETGKVVRTQHPLDAMNEQEVMAALGRLEAQPWGKGALQALVHITGEDRAFSMTVGRGETVMVDAGMLGDMSYFRLLQRLAELADPVTWDKAWEAARRRRDPDDPSRVLEKNKPDDQEAVARAWLAGKTDRPTGRSVVEDAHTMLTKELQRYANLEELGAKADESRGAEGSGVFEGYGRTMGEEQYRLFDADDPAQVGQRLVYKEWFAAEFPTGGEGSRPPLTLGEWGRHVMLPDGRIVVDTLRSSKNVSVAERGALWNRMVAAIRRGDIELTPTRRGFEVVTPEDPQLVLDAIKYRGTWRDLKQTELPAMVGRMQYKWHKWALARQAAEKGGVRATEQPGAVGRGMGKHEAVLESMPRPTDERALAVGLRQWFRRAFTLRGASPEQVELLSTIATKVGLAFRDIGKTPVTSIVGEAARKYAGMAFASGGRSGVALALWDFEWDHPGMRAAVPLFTAGHELMHHMVSFERPRDPAVAQAVDNLRQSAELMTPDMREAMMVAWGTSLFPERVRESAQFNDWFALRRQNARNPEADEFLSDLGGMAVMGLVRPDLQAKMSELIKWGGPLESQFVKMLYSPMMDLNAELAQYFKGVRRDMPGDEYGPVDMSDAMTAMGDNMRKLFNDVKQVEETAKALQQMEIVSPEQWTELVKQGEFPVDFGWRTEDEVLGGLAPSRATRRATAQAGQALLGARQPTQAEHKWPVNLSWFMKLVFPSAQMAATYSVIQGPMDAVDRFHPLVNTFAVKAAQPLLTMKKGLFGLTQRQVLDEHLTGFKEVVSNPAIERDASMLQLLQDQERKRFTPAEVATALPGRKPQHVEAVSKWLEASSQIHTRMGQLIVDVYDSRTVTRTAIMLRHENPNLTTAQAKALGRQVVDVQRRIRAGDAAAALDLVSLGVRTGAAATEAGNMLALVDKLHETVLNKPWHSSEMRLGQYMAAWREADGQGGSFAADTKAAVEAYVEKHLTPRGIKARLWDKYDRADATRGMHPDFLNSLVEIDRRQWGGEIENLQRRYNLSDDLTQALRDSHVPLQAVMKEVAEHGAGKFWLGQKQRPGREALNMPLGTLHYLQSMSTQLAKMVVADDLALALADSSLRGQDGLKKYVREHYQAVVNPSAPEMKMLKRLNFAYYLIASPSQMLIEGTQSLSTGLPQLTRDTGSASAGGRALSAALGFLGKMSRSSNRSTGDAVLDGLLKRARDEQVIDFGTIQEIVDAEGFASMQLAAALKGQKSFGAAWEQSKSAADWAFRLGRDLYAQMPRLNSHLMFIAAVDLARTHGVFVDGKLTKLSGEALYDYARHTVRRTMFGGGTSARPVGMFANKGDLQGVMGLMYSLGSFTFSTLAMYTRLAMDSIRQSVPAPERAAARKAFGQMLTTQAALAGGLGLPFAGAMLAVVEQFFPELEVKKRTEDAVFSAFEAVFDGNEKAGEIFSDMAMRGMPHGLLGVDLSNRLALSNLLGVSPYDGFSLDNLAGPVGSMVGNMFRAVQEFKTGDAGQGVKSLMPTPWKPTVDLMIGGGTVRDRRGRQVLADMTTGEKMSYAMGLRPSRLTKAKEAQQFSERHDALLQKEQAQFHRRLAEQMVAGEQPHVLRNALVAREQEKGRLRYNAEDGARTVVEYALDRLMPVDPARTGMRAGAAERQRLTQRAGIVQTSETQRVMTKKALERQLGVPGTTDGVRRALSQAQMVDYVRQQSPGLSRQEALAMVEEWQRRRR